MEKKAWIYKDGKRQVLEYTPSGKLSKNGEFSKKYPNGIIDILDFRAVLR